jgi:hypothetical protein
MGRENGAATVHASVAFVKIQEFARRPVMEQMRLRAQLEAVIAVTTGEIEPSGRLVLDASDGAAVVVLGNPHAALRLAERALTAAAAGLPMSAGLNHGAVQLAGDGSADDGMIGDGIAVAANIAEFAATAKLLASKSFRDALADAAPGEEACLVPAGVLTDPGLRSHELFAPDRRAARRRRLRFVAYAAVAAIGLVTAGVAFRIGTVGQERFLAETEGRGEALLGRLKFWEPPQAAPAAKPKSARDKGRG